MIKTYTLQYTKEKLNLTFDVAIDELKIFFSIVLQSGYVKCQSWKMYWESTSGTHNEGVWNAMSRNRFYQITKYIYCYDREEADGGDRCAKIRPIIEKLNELSIKCRLTEKKADVDESIVSYFGTYGASIKKTMHEKSIHFTKFGV